MADTKTTPEVPQNRSWSLRNIKDTRDNVAAAVASAAFVPEKCKAMIAEAIELNQFSAKLLRLDAHCQIVRTKQGAKYVLSVDISEI